MGAPASVEERMARAAQREARVEFVADLLAKRTPDAEIRRLVLAKYSSLTTASVGVVVRGDIRRVNAELKRRGLLRDVAAARELDLVDIDRQLARIDADIAELDGRAETYRNARTVLRYALDCATAAAAEGLKAQPPKSEPVEDLASAEEQLRPIDAALLRIGEERRELRDQALAFLQRRAEIFGYDARRELEESVPSAEEEAAREIGVDPKEFRRRNATNSGRLLRFATPGAAH